MIYPELGENQGRESQLVVGENFYLDERRQLVKGFFMTEKESSTQEAILLATIDCINEYGIEQLTTRMIAEKAGTNIASINYYFRTKEQLVNQVLEITIKHMLEDVIKTVEDYSLPFRQTLSDIFFYLIEGGRRFPGITTAHLYSLVVEKNYQSISSKSFREAFERIMERALENFPESDQACLRLLLSNIFSAIIFMMLTPGFLNQEEKYQPTNEENCRNLAEHFTKLFYAMM